MKRSLTRNLRGFIIGLLGMAPALALIGTARGADVDLFRQSVAPILEARCVSCHQGAKAKGGLALTSARSTVAGGESGAAIVPGKPDDSLLLQYVSGDKPEMPKNAAPLSAAEVDALRRWIAAGAAWPDGVTLSDKKVIDANWWSLLPIVRPAVPQIESTWVRTPVDRFVLAKLKEHDLQPAPEASRQTLIRRLYFDLLGLPPTADEVDAFAIDEDPQAYEKLVDRLLASPHYGERWARHWLDVVHYGETHGYDKDQPRPNAWPYRDYVIRAFNADKPYRRFLEEQLAGDVLYPDTIDGIEALGFIAAGPWDLIGHAEVPETKIDGKIARHLDRDDMVATTMNTFVSLTAQCAQCHNHKFDPILQEDYYCLQAIFAALDRADKSYDSNPETMRLREQLTRRQRDLTKTQQSLEEKIKQQGGPELAELQKQLATASKSIKAAAQGVEYGYHSAIEHDPAKAKWVQVDLGSSLPIERLVITPCYDDYNNIGAGFGFPLRYKIEACDDPTFAAGVAMIADQTQADVANPGTQPQEILPRGVAARYVRITATRLALRQNDYMFALAELAVYDASGDNVALKKPVTAADSIEAVPRWSRNNLVDGIFPPLTKSPGQMNSDFERCSAERTRFSSARSTRPRAARWPKSPATWPTSMPSAANCPRRSWSTPAQFITGRADRSPALARPAASRARSLSCPAATSRIRAAKSVPAPSPPSPIWPAASTFRPMRAKGSAAPRWPVGWPTTRTRSPGGRSSTACGSITLAAASSTRPTILAAWASCPRIPNCSTGWPANFATAASRSSNCIA